MFTKVERNQESILSQKDVRKNLIKKSIRKMIVNAFFLNELDNFNKQLIINWIYKYSDIFFINQIFALYNDEKYGFNFPNN